jgi:hypothetical protein
MKIIADSRGRLTAADLFPAHTAFDARKLPDGSIRLIELVEKPLPKARIVTRGGRKLLTNDRIVTLADTQQAMEEFP